MGRRKKEAPKIHRESISGAAERLFLAKGIQGTTMDDIAREAGYSKATLYVYFRDKEEIISFLALRSMEKLYHYIHASLETQTHIRAQYDLLCHSLQQYQEEYPLYFSIALGKINIDGSAPDGLTEDRESFRIGEEINGLIGQFLQKGIQSGQLRPDLNILPAIFSFWGMLSGLIQTAANKEPYILRELHLSKEEFLEYGFDTLYRSISNHRVPIPGGVR